MLIDIEKLIDSVLERDLDPSVFNKVDDRDFPEAPNVLEFCIGKEYLNVAPYPRQIEILVSLFEEWCPDCTDPNLFIEGLHRQPLPEILDRLQMLNFGVCPKCKKNKFDFYKEGKFTFPYELDACIGQRAGKSAVTAMASNYVYHRFLKLPSPAHYFGLMPGSTLHGTFTAITHEQAEETLFQPFLDQMEVSPWFKRYYAMLDHHEKTLGVELYDVANTFVWSATKKLTIYPKGPDKRKMRGRCLPGYTLINTDRGLIRLDNSKKLLGATTYRGKSKRRIIDHLVQERKEVLRVTLENGIELDASFDHRVLTLNGEGKRKWVEQKDLLGKYVFCQLGGEFPDKLSFDHDIELHTPVYIQIANFISDGRPFTLDSLAEKYNLHKNSVLSWHLGPMIRSGVLYREPQRDCFGHPLPSIYRINGKFKLEDWNKLKKGKINNNRKKVTIPTHMTPELARLIGYLIADADLSFSNRAACFVTTSIEKKEDFDRLFQQVFGCKVKSSGENSTGYGPNGDKPCYSSAFSYNSIRSFLEYLGLFKVNARTKTLPWCILEAPRNCVVECISAMISCDGAIVSSGHTGVYYSSKSRKLLKQLQLTMMRLGYYCVLKREHVTLSRKASVDFLKEYTGLNKRDHREDATITLSNHLRSYSRYRIPFSGGCSTLSEINKRFNLRVPKEFEKYCDSNLIFSKVTKISSIGKKKVYDLSVDADDALFPANNVLVHNTRFLYSVDEIGWFSGTDGQVKMDADEIDHALSRSMSTVRIAAMNKRVELGDFNAPLAYAFNISSPSHANDKIMRLVRAGRTDPTKKVFHLPTWLAHPNITRASLEPEFKRSPAEAERDYGANPPIADSPFISNVDAIKQCFSDKSQSSLVQLNYLTGTDRGEKPYTYAEAKVYATDKTIPFVLSIDAGYTNNSFALVLSHWENDYIFHDIVIEIEPQQDTYINFSKVFDHVMVPLFSNFNIRLLTADRWNSIKVLHDAAEKFNVETKQYSLTWDNLVQYRQSVLENKVHYPKTEKPIEVLFNASEAYESLVRGNPVLHSALQMMTVKEIGKRVEKGDGLTDDLFRAAVLGAKFLTDDAYSYLRTKGSHRMQSRRMIGSVKTHSQGGGGATSSRLGGVRTKGMK